MLEHPTSFVHAHSRSQPDRLFLLLRRRHLGVEAMEVVVDATLLRLLPFLYGRLVSFEFFYAGADRCFRTLASMHALNDCSNAAHPCVL